MYNYLAFLDAGIDQLKEGPIEDGRMLAKICLGKLANIDNPEQFPPKLLILLVSASYLNAETSLDETKAHQLIAGIHQAFSEAGHLNIPLIGSTVAAVFYKGKIFPKGALLVCLASRLIEARVAVGQKVSDDPETAIDALLNGLETKDSVNEYPKTLPNRALLTIFPDSVETDVAVRQPTDELHRLLLERMTYKIPIVGGVSAANDPTHKKRALQFAGRQTFTDALAACLILSGVPLGTSLAKGLEPLKDASHKIVRVKRLSKNGRTIEEFDEGSPGEVLGNSTRPILLRDFTPDSSYVRGEYLPDLKGGPVRVLRKVRERATLEVCTPTARMMSDEAEKACQHSMERAGIGTPIGGLSIKCAGPYRYRKALHLDIEEGISSIGALLNNSPYVGGFFDGEAGTIETGSSEYGNWCVAAMVFGDEVSESTGLQVGFGSLTEHGADLAGTFNIEEVLKQSLELIYDLGFAGAMISILMPDQEEKRFIPMRAKGARFEKLRELMNKKGSDDPIPDSILLDKQPLFIPDSSLVHNSVEEITRESGILSQYVLPLFDPKHEVFAVLRVDLGNERHRNKIHPAMETVLEPIAAMVGAAINRIFNWEESKIAHELDNALIASLSAKSFNQGSERFIKDALSTFGLKMGHIRLFEFKKDQLKLVAGSGKYHEAAKKYRSNPDKEDWSPSWDAFDKNQIMIINDAPNNTSHKSIRKRYSGIEPMKNTLEEIASYANVPVTSEDRAIGTISLISEDKWFFHAYHERALTALGQRASYLVDYFVRDEREAKVRQKKEALSKKLRFLQYVSPDFYLITNFDDIQGVLGGATRKFCRGVGAECACLFVWDEDQEKFILRAEEGWRSEGWINGARYGKDSQWIGNRLEKNIPLYIPNLHEYYRAKQYPENWGFYAIHMFGKKVSAEFPWEAIAVPLQVGDERLGALTFYRRIDPKYEKSSGFKIKDINLLQEGANRVAGLVKLLLSHQIIRFDQIAQDRHQDIYQVLTGRQEIDIFERTVCEKVLNSFKADRVDFYKIEGADSSKCIWIRGLHRNQGRVEEQGSQEPDAMIETVVANKLLKAISHQLTEDQKQNPAQAATEGFLERAGIPLLAAGSLVGVLDVHWRISTCMDTSLLGSRGEKQLTEIGRMIGAAYARQRLTLQQERTKEDAEQSRLAVQAVGAMVFQTAHRFTNLMGNIYNLTQFVRHAESELLRLESLEQLSEVVSQAQKEINWPMDTARRLQQVPLQSRRLRDLIDQSIECADKPKFRMQTSLVGLDDIFVMVDPDHSRQAFVNLINNAIHSMNEKRRRELNIHASVVEKKRARVVIEDSGVGMTQEEIHDAERGFVTRAGRAGRAGVGVLIAKVLLYVQGGVLMFESTKGVGTRAIVTLPITNGGE